MTKEECEKALDDVVGKSGVLNNCCGYIGRCIKNGICKFDGVTDDCADYMAFNTLKQLIQEHFDNPPLSFDDLKEGMWVWDDKEKLYCIIRDIFHNKNLVTGFKTSFGNSDNRIMQGMDHFEENRFYRRQKEE